MRALGQMQSFIELKLKDIRFGHFAERLMHTEKLDDVELTNRQMDYIYSDNAACYFMDPETFEQVGVPKDAVGKVEKFLKEGMKKMLITIKMRLANETKGNISD